MLRVYVTSTFLSLIMVLEDTADRAPLFLIDIFKILCRIPRGLLWEIFLSILYLEKWRAFIK